MTSSTLSGDVSTETTPMLSSWSPARTSPPHAHRRHATARNGAPRGLTLRLESRKCIFVNLTIQILRGEVCRPAVARRTDVRRPVRKLVPAHHCDRAVPGSWGPGRARPLASMPAGGEAGAMSSNCDPGPLHFLLLWFAGWTNRRQQQVIDDLLEENSVLREQLGGRRLRSTDEQRRRLAVKGRLLGRKVLDQVAAVAKPDTILRWYRKLVANRYDGSKTRRPGRPRTSADTADLVVKMAHENPSAAGLAVHEQTGVRGGVAGVGVGRAVVVGVARRAGGRGHALAAAGVEAVAVDAGDDLARPAALVGRGEVRYRAQRSRSRSVASARGSGTVGMP